MIENKLSISQERIAFENWYMEKTRRPWKGRIFDTRGTCYCHQDVQNEWEAWLAAKEHAQKFHAA